MKCQLLFNNNFFTNGVVLNKYSHSTVPKFYRLTVNRVILCFVVLEYVFLNIDQGDMNNIEKLESRLRKLQKENEILETQIRLAGM